MSYQNKDITSENLIQTLDEIQNMYYNVLILYNAHAKGNQEFTNLANLTFYILWNYSKFIIVLKLFFTSTHRCEQDFAIGQLCVTINESIKHLIGFKTKKGRNWNKTMWIKCCGNYISNYPHLEQAYNDITDRLISFADNFENDSTLKNLRNIATHGDDTIPELLKLNQITFSVISHYLDGWGRCLRLASDFAFKCFIKECQHEMNNK